MQSPDYFISRHLRLNVFTQIHCQVIIKESSTKTNYSIRRFFFSKLRKLANWQLANCNGCITCNHRGPETDFFMRFGHHSFLHKAHNDCTNKQLRINKHQERNINCECRSVKTKMLLIWAVLMLLQNVLDAGEYVWDYC